MNHASGTWAWKLQPWWKCLDPKEVTHSICWAPFQLLCTGSFLRSKPGQKVRSWIFSTSSLSSETFYISPLAHSASSMSSPGYVVNAKRYPPLMTSRGIKITLAFWKYFAKIDLAEYITSCNYDGAFAVEVSLSAVVVEGCPYYIGGRYRGTIRTTTTEFGFLHPTSGMPTWWWYDPVTPWFVQPTSHEMEIKYKKHGDFQILHSTTFAYPGMGVS